MVALVLGLGSGLALLIAFVAGFATGHQEGSRWRPK